MRMARSDPRYVHGVLARGAIATRIQVRAASDEQAEQLAGALSVPTGEALTAGTCSVEQGVMVRNGRRLTWPAGELIGRGQVIAV